jgi:4-amino-4-deoxy-L-arabinose transferase-like glycosyltransferase
MFRTRMRSAVLPALVVAAYLALGVAYQRTVPLFEAPDEPSHLEYMAFLAMNHRIPLYGAHPEVPGEGMQPPLYYALGAPLYAALVEGPAGVLLELHRADLALYGLDRRPLAENRLVRIRSGGHVPGRPLFDPAPGLRPLLELRWLSRLFGAAAVLLTFLATQRAFGDEPLAALAALLLGLNPQFLFVSGSVSNDAAATCVGAAALLLVVHALQKEGVRRRDYLGLGLLAVIGLLTKSSTLPGLGVAAVAIFAADRRPLGARVRDSGLGLGLASILAAPYLGWNTLYRGDPLGTTAVLESALELAPMQSFGGIHNFFTRIYPYWTFESYWARFGWMDVRAPLGVHLVYLVLTLVGVVGFAVGWRRGFGSGSPRSGAIATYLVGALLASVAAHLWLNLQTPQPQGRHLFASAPPAACLLALGLRNFAGTKPTHLGWPAAAALLAALAGLALYCLLRVLAPIYAPA